MKILIVTSSDSSWNSIRPEAELFIELARRGHQLTVMTQAGSEYGRRYAANGIKVIDHHPRNKISFEYIGINRREIQAEPYNIVYATNSKSIPNAAFACIGQQVKFVTYRGTTGGLYRRDPSAYLTHLHPRVDGIVCVSRTVRDDVQSRVWKNRKWVVAIHKGHDLAWYDQQSADLGEFGIGQEAFVAICAVNARPSKGIEVMLRAAKLLADLDRFHLLLVGRNMDREPYTSLIKASGMCERIHVTGYRHDAPELIGASSVLVQPSISGEGLPRAMMEALGNGTPSIITTTGGGQEVITDGVNGFVVAANDPQWIAERIRQLYDQPLLLDTMATCCRETLATRFSLQQTASHYESYFSAILEQ